MSFVPKIVVRRFVNEPHRPIRAPEVESYLSCVLFADISGNNSYFNRFRYYYIESALELQKIVFIPQIKSHGKDMILFLDRGLKLELRARPCYN